MTEQERIKFDELYKINMKKTALMEKYFDMFLMIILGLLQTLDFLFTWYGINELNIIAEGNPFMIWLFELSFKSSLSLRLLFVFTIIGVLAYIRKHNRLAAVAICIIGIILNIIIGYMHFLWIKPYMIFPL